MHEEGKLIDGCIANDLTAQRQLYEKYATRMLVVCMRYANDRAEAEDILQQGFFKVYDNIRQFRGEGSLEGWIRRIMINTALKNYRKKVRLEPLVELHEASAQSEEEMIMSQYGFEELLKFIQKLPDRYRVVFNLFVIEEYSHREISEMTDIPEATSRSHLARGRKMLQDMIKKNEKITNTKFYKS